MSSFDAVINLRATDQASPVVDAATKNILANYKIMRQEVKAVTAEFQLQNSTLVAASNAFRSVGSIAGGFMNVFTQFQTMQIRATDVQNRLILAQLHYNQVLAEQGPGTNDAIAASIELSEAKQAVAQSSQQETIGYIGMAFELGGAVSQIINAIPVFERLATKLGLVKGAAIAASAAISGVGGGISIPGVTTKTGKQPVPSTGPISTTRAVETAAGKEAGAIESTAAGVAGTGLAAAAVKKTPSLLGRLGSTAAEIGPKLGIASAGVELLSMMGEQQAGGGETTTPGENATAAGGDVLPTGLDALSEVAGDVSDKLSDFGDKLSNFFEGKGFVNSPPSRVEHVVTIKIDNPTDHIVTAQEKAMGIQQVYQSGQ